MSSVQFASLKEVCHGVVGHVDGRVGEALDEPGLVPRHLAAQPEGSAARVLLQPAQRRFKVFPRNDLS